MRGMDALGPWRFGVEFWGLGVRITKDYNALSPNETLPIPSKVPDPGFEELTRTLQWAQLGLSCNSKSVEGSLRGWLHPDLYFPKGSM